MVEAMALREVLAEVWQAAGAPAAEKKRLGWQAVDARLPGRLGHSEVTANILDTGVALDTLQAPNPNPIPNPHLTLT